MTSRLDRLFILLESGSSSVTRRAAAKQIGEVQKLYPHELHALLNRLIGYLHSTSWDTRIAAAQSVEAILMNVPAWQPELYAIKREREVKKEESQLEQNHMEEDFSAEDSCQSASSSCTNNKNSKDKFLTFTEFDLEQILHKGARLIGSAGIEFDVEEVDEAQKLNSEGTENVAERLRRQRALLNEKLGLTQASKLGVNLTEMITDEDMLLHNTDNSKNINDEKVPVEDILKMQAKAVDGGGQKLSCREMNRAKRKARQSMTNTSSATTSGGNLSRRDSANTAPMPGVSSSSASSNGSHNGSQQHNTIAEPSCKKAKMNSSTQEVFYSVNAPVPDATGAWVDAVSWPLENFCTRLYLDLFNPKWEVRHGAATALRELINHHCKGAGKSLDMTREEMIEYHNLWLEDAALRLLCVLCLDRFGDFVSDQVVAPVRETVAQVLGTIVKEMPVEKVDLTVDMLSKLLKQKEWEVRHGGLLGLKYVFVVREDLLKVYLPTRINDVLMGLFDPVDDVGAVAATTLIPVATWLPKLLTPLQVSSIVKMLWDLLLDPDELTSASNSFMGLLAEILSLPNAAQWIQMEPMSVLIPRLWPFLSHSTSSVRKSTLLTLQTLTNINNDVKKTENEPKSEIISSTDLSALTKNVHMNFDSTNLKLNLGVIDWPITLLQESLRHIFQRILVEPLTEIQKIAKSVWLSIVQNADLGILLHAACPFVSPWICLAMQPPRLAFDVGMLIHANRLGAGNSATASNDVVNAHLNQRRRNQRFVDDLSTSSAIIQKLYLGGSEATPVDIRERNHTRARVTAARVLGTLSRYLVQPAPGIVYTPEMESPTDCYVKVLLGHLNSRSAVQRIVCALIIAFWAQADERVCPGPTKLQEKLRECVLEYCYYDEVANSFTRLLQESKDLIATLKQYKVPIEDFNNVKILTLVQIESLATTLTTAALNGCTHLKPKIQDTLEERRKALLLNFQQTSAEQSAYNVSAQAALAGAIVSLHCLPEKLNPIVKPLMESIKREDCELLQELSAEFLVHLMKQICDRTPSPNSKILTNLCTLLRSDGEFTPKITFSELTLNQTPVPKSSNADCVYYGILTLSSQQHTSNFGQRGGGVAGQATRGPGRPPLNETLASTAAAGSAANENSNLTNEEAKNSRIQRLGSSVAIFKLCSIFGQDLIERIPIFEHLMFGKISEFVSFHKSMKFLSDVLPDCIETNELLTSLQLFEIATPHLHPNLQDRLFSLLPCFGIVATHPLKAIRHMNARCIATLASIDACRTMDFVVNDLVQLLSKIEHVIQRQGAVEAIERVVDKLQIGIVPYIVLLVLPLLGCMSDVDESVRLLSTHCFATLVQLMPLDSKAQNGECEIKSTELLARKTRDREFLDFLFSPRTIPDYRVPVPISVELRSYQQAGVNWLWFLNKYNLHGILCDDMGLGKTLQTICILAGDHHDSATNLPSLVICPPTLTGHWVYEVEKFLQKSTILRPLHYVGLPSFREKLRCQIGKPCNLIVTSYDTIRKDIDFFNTIHWNYCVLDEGHIIKNGKTKSSRAIKMLKAKHRLILSGTPIQNNVLELWSLFDFLMPGFLGTEKAFIARYSRPILASRDSKSSSKEQEAGVFAMESLHRQVLPFLLRRVKEDVLTDLPPKITQDLLCELSPLQERLYEDFSKTHLNSDLKDCLENLGDNKNINPKTHIFHALRYLQNVCNHPKLVLNAKHPEYERIIQELQQHQSSLNDIEHSAKLPALKQLLLDCGIGIQTETVSQHRALIFCQLKSMLDIVEKDLLRKHMPSVTYLRLDGSVPASLRQDIVNNFNSDPSIDVLLLTTQVGGLGLNLTGADTVIFVEHDWNPMKDLQAMDRAHRIGQKKVVNVYRLITRKSLEEKIMGLQKFKILTANTVVSSENASMDTMDTEQLFDLFTLKDQQKNGNAKTAAKTNSAVSGAGSGNHVSINTIIESLPELWSENEYDDEYDMRRFMQTIKK